MKKEQILTAEILPTRRIKHISGLENSFRRRFRRLSAAPLRILCAALFILYSALCMTPAAAQEVSVDVRPVQPILPPKAGDYIDDPGNFFTLRVTNNTDEQQRLFFGCHINMEFPDQESYVVTNYGHIPRMPIVLEPRQSKLLNRVEMKQLFTYLDQNDVYMRDGLWDQFNGAGLLPEGQFKMSMQCYKWDPELTQAVQLNEPTNGTCSFQVCYRAQPPTFITPQAAVGIDPDDALGQLSVANLNIHSPVIAWTMPTLKCNSSQYPFQYDVRIVRLDGEMPDVAIETHATEYENLKLTTPTLTIPTAYVTKMKEQTQADGQPAVYALQVKAINPFINSDLDKLHFSLIENDGRSPILLFRFYDPTATDVADSLEGLVEEGDKEGDKDSLYVFEQPTLTSPKFSGLALRKMFVGDSITAGFRKAWHVGGRGEQADTVQFKYTMQLFKGRSSDKMEVTIATQKPFFEHSFVPKKGSDEELRDSAKWEKLKDKVKAGDYVVMRIKAEPLDKKLSLRMKGDSLNIIDFAMAEHVNIDWACGLNTSTVTNKELVKECPKKGTKIRISDWELELDDVKQDKDTKVLKGTGWIIWEGVSQMNVRVAVKFNDLKVNTDLVCFDGLCQTYADPNGTKWIGDDENYSPEAAVDSIFSMTGLDNFWTNAGLGAANEAALNKDMNEEATDVAKALELGKYYSYFEKGCKRWNEWKKGNWFEVYFPTEFPEEVSQYFPKDFALQIASMMYSPKGACMNIIAEFVLPKSDVLGNDLLVFGAPRLCVSKDRFLPEDGVLSLLSNFRIKDPDSDFDLTFLAPSQPLDPYDGCFIRWENDAFDGLSIHASVHVPNLNRVENGKVLDGVEPNFELRATIENGWGDWMGKIHMDPFEVRDLPGWVFTVGEDVVYDHSYEHNDIAMPSLNQIISKVGNTYNPALCGSYTKTDWNAWQGLYIKKVALQFPKWCVFGKGDKGTEVFVEDMLFDGSGVTLATGARNVMNAQTGEAGGWAFDIDTCIVQIVQNNFDKCRIAGKFGVPLFGVKDSGDDGKIGYWCDIRRLTKPETETYYTYVKAGDGSSSASGTEASGTKASGTKATSIGGKGSNTTNTINTSTATSGSTGTTLSGKGRKGSTAASSTHNSISTPTTTTTSDGYEKIAHKRSVYTETMRYAYLFHTESIDKNRLQMDCFLADLNFDPAQTFIALAAEEQEDGTTKTDVEFCMGGEIALFGATEINDKIAKYTAELPLKPRIPGVHFTKLYISNFKREGVTLTASNNLIMKYDAWMGNLEKKRQEAQEKWEKETIKWADLHAAKEMKLGEHCYLNFGEWSLASPDKKIGPFKFNITEFKPDYKNKQLTLDITGKVGLIKGINLDVKCGISIVSDLSWKDFTDVSTWDLSYNHTDFKKLALDLDVAKVLHFKGELEMGDFTDKNNVTSKGYKGLLDIDIIGFFGMKATGGFFEYDGAVSKASEEKLQEEAKEEGTTLTADDRKFSWGYFMCDITSSLMRVDPVVINRVSGGFYFNCKPKGQGLGGDNPEARYGTPTAEYGAIGVSLGIGLESSAGKETLSADLDLTVVYNRKKNRLSTFMFKGGVKAIAGMIKADMMLLYQNDDKDRFLSLDVSVETDMSGGDLGDKVKKLGEEYKQELEVIQKDLDKFKEDVAGYANKLIEGTPMAGLKDALADDDESGAKVKASDFEKNKSSNDAKADEAEKKKKEKDLTIGETKITLALKITWRENGVNKNPQKWHLYVGEPNKSKRCYFQYIKFKSAVVSVDIGADGYICIGNELPNNGALPPIDSEITNFVTPKGVDTGGDMAKAQRSRQAAVNELLGKADCKGGVMVGASAWGFIDIDLGLFYGGLRAIAGFDMSLVNYGNMAYCVNLGRAMGRNGWYAQGQFYAYLAAKFGLHIKLGKLINKKIDIVDAGIGGVFQCGLPSPSWLEGRARVKLRLLGGLVNMNKTFHFECGKVCVPFKGNALDGFNLFGDVNIGIDSIETKGWYEVPTVTNAEAKRAMFSTQASLGAQYRLYDPTTGGWLASQGGYTEDQIKQNASRTYIFDIDGTTNNIGNVGVKLYEISESKISSLNYFQNKNVYLENLYSFFKKNTSSFETSVEMSNASITGGQPVSYSYSDASTWTPIEQAEQWNKQLEEDWYGFSYYGQYRSYRGFSLKKMEVPVSIREVRGSNFHLNLPTLKPGCYYILRLTGSAYEVEDGVRVWCNYVKVDKNGKPLYNTRIKWQQDKFIFFRTGSEETPPELISDLDPYVAVAFPAGEDGKLFNKKNYSEESYQRDLERPNIALNQDISKTSFKNGTLYWNLESQNTKTGDTRTTKVKNKFVKVQMKTPVYGRTLPSSVAQMQSINMAPESKLFVYPYPSNNHLQLLYETQIKGQCNSGSVKYPNSSSYANLSSNYEKHEFLKQYLGTQGYGNYIQPILDEIKSQLGSKSYYISAIAYMEKIIQDDEVLKTAYERYMDENSSKEECMKDTTYVLADLYFKCNKYMSWSAPYGFKSQSSIHAASLLPYEAPFVGMRPFDPPTYSTGIMKDYPANSYYTWTYSNDEAEAYRNVWRVQKNYRRQDPFSYFAYLSNHVFINGYKVNPYAFDDVGISHAAEPLTFSYNGVDIQGNFMLQSGNETMRDVQRKMYNTWNNFYYDNASAEGYDPKQPFFPLPSYGVADPSVEKGELKHSQIGSMDLYEKTIANQDGKTPHYLPTSTSADAISARAASMRYFALNFMSPYFVATKLYTRMAEVCDELVSIYQQHMDKRINALKNLNSVAKTRIANLGYDLNTPNGRLAAALDDRVYKTLKNYGGQTNLLYFDGSGGDDWSLNGDIRKWNQKYRGRYLTVESHGYKVKVPYYQFALLFGDCFGRYNHDNSDTMGADSVNGFWTKSLDRAFDTSLGAHAKTTLKARYGADVSNLLFNRMNGGSPFKQLKGSSYATSSRVVNGQWVDRRTVDQDRFITSWALGYITELNLMAYRVNAYDINSGQYFSSSAVDGNCEIMTDVTYDWMFTGSNKNPKDMNEWRLSNMVGDPKVVCDGDDPSDKSEDIYAGEDVKE